MLHRPLPINIVNNPITDNLFVQVDQGARIPPVPEKFIVTDFSIQITTDAGAFLITG